MPDGIMEQWERIIRKVVTFDFKGNEQPMELTFSLEAHRKLCQWKKSVNNAIYTATESEAEKAVCGKLEIYLMRFCLIIRIMKNICNEESAAMIDTGSAEAAIELVEYFREMENRVIRVSLSGNLDKRQSELLGCHRHRTVTRNVGVHGKTVPEKLCHFQKRGAWTLHENVM